MLKTTALIIQTVFQVTHVRYTQISYIDTINEKTVDLCVILSIIEPNTNLRENGIVFLTIFYELLWYSFGEYKGS